MKKRLLAFLLAFVLCFALAACGGSAEESADPSIEVDLSQDILAFSAGLSAEDTMLTINGEDIPADRFLFELYASCDNYLADHSILGYTVKDNADYLLQNTVNYLLSYTLVRQNAEEYGYAPTRDQLDQAWSSMYAEGQQVYEKNKALYGLTDESMDYEATLDYYYSNLLDTFPAPSMAELNDYFYQAKHILLKTTDVSAEPALSADGEYAYPSLGEEVEAEKLALAQNILAQLNAVDGEERLALYDQLMEQYSEDGRNENGDLYVPAGYLTTPGKMVKEFEDAALALDYGEISGIVKSGYGYHIILRVEIKDLSSNYNEYAHLYREYEMGLLLAEWAKDAEIVRSAVLDSLNVADFYARYAAYQAALNAQSAGN